MQVVVFFPKDRGVTLGITGCLGWGRGNLRWQDARSSRVSEAAKQGLGHWPYRNLQGLNVSGMKGPKSWIRN